MRVLVTGARGFVGRWLTRELEGAGHEVVAVGRDELDVTDLPAAVAALREATPDAVAHLAAVSYGPEAARDPAEALRVTVGGTVTLFEAIRSAAGTADRDAPAVLVAGSADVYGRPDPDDLPLTEAAPLRPLSVYALTKAAQEAVALAAAARAGLRVVATRSFNHSGPGQRPDFVVPALAERVRAVVEGRASTIPVGNVDVRRDFTDVRDVARAYRLLLEAAVTAKVAPGGVVLNVASGRSVLIRDIADAFRRLAGTDAPLEIEPSLVRRDEAPEIRGDASALTALTGWQPTRSLDAMLGDVWAAPVSTRPRC